MLRIAFIPLCLALPLAGCSGEPHDGYLPEPRQSDIASSPGGEGLHPVARFSARVLVLSRRGYGGLLGDDLSEFSPFDLAVAWGQAAQADVYRAVSISQSGRFYYWRASADAWQDPRVREFGRQSANWHIVPETSSVAADFYTVSDGDVIEIEGYLVDIDGKDGRQWKTSRTRTDIGAGACEIILVRMVREVAS